MINITAFDFCGMAKEMSPLRLNLNVSYHLIEIENETLEDMKTKRK